MALGVRIARAIANPVGDTNAREQGNWVEEGALVRKGAQMEADEPGQPPGPPFCHPPPPRPSGRPPKEPRSEVGRLVQYLKEGVAAVAPEVDGGCFDASDYTTGKFSLKGEVSQDITIPDGSRLASALTRGSEAAGEEISKAIMRVRPYCGLSRSMAQRELLLPRALVDADAEG